MEETAKVVRDKARHARRLAEQMGNDADKKRLNAYADELDQRAQSLQESEKKNAG